MLFKTVKEAWDLVGGLSDPSKMPGYGYSIPPKYCKLGQVLAKIAGTVCHSCYAMKGRYVFPVVVEAMERRYQSLNNPLWEKAMAFIINTKNRKGKYPEFRWHDAGDVQSVQHVKAIAEVCRLTPDIRHWMPTRELGIIADTAERGVHLPENLTIRLSAGRVNQRLRTSKLASMVVSDKNQKPDDVFMCPSKGQGNQCLTCRACWDKSIQTIAYYAH